MLTHWMVTASSTSPSCRYLGASGPLESHISLSGWHALLCHRDTAFLLSYASLFYTNTPRSGPGCSIGRGYRHRSVSSGDVAGIRWFAIPSLRWVACHCRTTFLMSGIFHDVEIRAVGRGGNILVLVGFFIMNGVGILVECVGQGEGVSFPGCLQVAMDAFVAGSLEHSWWICGQRVQA